MTFFIPRIITDPDEGFVDESDEPIKMCYFGLGFRLSMAI